MSHFTVLVIGDNPEAQLAAYHEFECTGLVDKYIQNVDKLEEAKKEYEEDTDKKLQGPNGKYHCPYDDKFYREPTAKEAKDIGTMCGSGCRDGYSYTSQDWKDGKGYRPKVNYIPKGYKEVKVQTKKIMSFRDFVTEHYEKEVVMENDEVDIHGKHKYGWVRLNKKGEVLELITRTNPNSKWDWYQIGGRWAGSLKLKPSKGGVKGEPSLVGMMDKGYAKRYIETKSVDQAKVGDIDFTPNKKTLKDSKRFWELYVEGDKPKNDEDKDLIKHCFYKKEYYQERYSSKEDYAQRQAEFITFAVVKDGQWYEKGEMGWFGCSSDTGKDAKKWDKSFHDKWLKGLPKDTMITVVDCHI